MTELWYRFNFVGEQRFFAHSFLIDGIIVPAHLLALYPGTLPAFFSDLKSDTLIDPMTYVWDIDRKYVLKDSRLKKSFQKYIEFLNCKTAKILSNERIRNIDTNSKDFQEFVDSVLQFQMKIMADVSSPRRRSLERIRKTRGKERTQVNLYGLITPYFYFTNVTEDGYEKTVYSANYSVTEYGDEYKIIPCLCFEKNILNDYKQQEKIIEDFSYVDEIIFWINDFDETTASRSEIKGLFNLIQLFSKKNIPVMNFYGGYLSLLLGKMGLSKFSCGICVSDHKNVFTVPGGGGLPIRYYENNYKKKFTATPMIRLYSGQIMPKLTSLLI